MAGWTPFPHLGAYPHDAASVTRLWSQLHAGDAQPLPQDPAALQAWVLFHRGEFEAAVRAGLAAGGDGVTAANKAQAIHATYLETREKARLDLYLEVAERARAQTESRPHDAAGWYWQAYALGRYSQTVSVAKALAQGLGGKVKAALERAIELQPRHADAHVALGAFHAEVIDKVGAMVAALTYGARKDEGLRLFEQGLRLHPQSAIGLLEYADGLVMLEGEARMPDATRLYEQACATQPLDATERLHVELARLELQD